jgi:hypothetical protein
MLTYSPEATNSTAIAVAADPDMPGYRNSFPAFRKAGK